MEKHKGRYEELNGALDLSQKYKKYAAIKYEINMIRESAHNTIGNLKYLLNE